MPLPKYRQYYQLMIEKNQKLFEDFAKIHQNFVSDPEKHAEQFHTQGRDILDAIRDWERRLCSGTERGTYAKYSVTLAEKFWNEVRKDYPLVDKIGVTIKKSPKN